MSKKKKGKTERGPEPLEKTLLRQVKPNKKSILYYIIRFSTALFLAAFAVIAMLFHRESFEVAALFFILAMIVWRLEISREDNQREQEMLELLIAGLARQIEKGLEHDQALAFIASKFDRKQVADFVPQKPELEETLQELFEPPKRKTTKTYSSSGRPPAETEKPRILPPMKE